jgi:formyltetrahydrofolate deformylase
MWYGGRAAAALWSIRSPGFTLCPVSDVSDNAAVLLVSCPDRKGIVSALAQMLYGHGANILDADQHRDPEAGQFFQRIAFDLTELRTDRVSLELGIGEVAERFQMRFRLAYRSQRKRLAVFVSKYEHCLYDLLLRHRAGELDCEIPLIISNHGDLEPVARQFGIDYHVFPITKDDREAQEDAELRLLLAASVDCVVLARYMQILSPNFVARLPEAIINIHHSFLPAFVGPRPHHQAHARGVKLIGATAHYVTSELDEGPIIAQGVARTSHRDCVRDLVRKGRDLERMVLSQAVMAHIEDRVLTFGNKTVVFE